VVAAGPGYTDFTVPKSLVSLEGVKEPPVKYCLRFYTGSKMGHGLSAPDAGVQVMLIGEDGRAFMLRVDRYPDVGGMADLALYSRPRFERGNIDEVTFDAPDLGLPTAMWIAPESGGEWFLEEVELSCSEGSAMAAAVASSGIGSVVSFPCMDVVGGRDPALELRPSVFVRMTAEQRERMRADGIREYGELKVRMLVATGVAVVLGCAVTAAMGARGGAHDSLESMRAFASGGSVGLVYLWMLMCSVDTVGVVGSERSAAAHVAAAVAGLAASSPVRLLLLGLVGAVGLEHLEAAATVDPVSGVAHPAYGEALAAMLGFFSYKAGVLVAGFAGTPVSGPSEEPSGGSMQIPMNNNRPRRVEPW